MIWAALLPASPHAWLPHWNICQPFARAPHGSLATPAL